MENKYNCDAYDDGYCYRFGRPLADEEDDECEDKCCACKKATQEFKEKLESGYFSLGKEYDTTSDKELVNIIDSLNSEESKRDGARMKEYVCKEDISKAMMETNMSVSPLSIVNAFPVVTKADILHEFEEWYAEHCDFSEVQLYEFRYKWKRWIEDFIAEKEQRE